MHDVSIIVPIYCDSQESLVWLSECLDSACSQDCEVVVHDDGSPLYNDVKRIVAKHDVARFSRSVHNEGVSSARNRAAVLASRSLIFPLDCDDTVAPQAIQKLYSAWDGIPIYPDIAKFGLEVEDHYTLLNFDCSYLLTYIGFTSVNVLHSKKQWESIGGWDKSIDFYEDGEYNARLLGTYCGLRYPEPLVNYRMHSSQRTKQYQDLSYEYARKLLAKIRSMEMPCPGCSQRKTISNLQGQQASRVTRSEPVDVQIGERPVNLPLEFEGKVLAQYVGNRGAGAHYYRGVGSKFPYYVTYGDYVYADPRDVGDDPMRTKLIVAKPIEQATPVVTKGVDYASGPDQTIVEEVYNDDVVEEVVEDLPNIAEMSVKSIQSLELDEGQAAKLLVMEQRGLNRSKVVEWLQSRV